MKEHGDGGPLNRPAPADGDAESTPGPETAKPLRPGRRGLLAAGLAILAVWLWVTVPLATGGETLFFRDVLGNHFALKAFGAAELARGEIPAVNPTLGLGQPFRGNPSALAFYPGNLLYLLLPFWSAFNLHFALHWLLALLAMALLARRLGLGPAPALMAGLTYAGGGWFLSTFSFYNVIAVAAWWPLAMAGAVAGAGPAKPTDDPTVPAWHRWRGVALGGGACGMALLAGEPVTAALGMVPLIVLAVGRHGRVRGLARGVAVGAIGLVVALPQVVATWRVLGASLRGGKGVQDLATHFSLPALRLVELVLPLPFGWPLDVGPRGWWLGRTAPDIGYYLSLYAGVIALWLAVRAVRRRPAWAVLAAAALAGAVLLAAAPELVENLTGGLFRYPEKLLFWYALAVPLLAAQGLEDGLARVRGGGAGTFWGTVVGGLAALAAAVALALTWPGVAEGSPAPDVVAAQSSHLLAYLTLAGVLLLAGGMALRRGAAATLVLLQLVALLQLFPLLRTMPTEPISRPAPWNQLLGVEGMGQGSAVFHTQMPRPVWEPPPRRPVVAGTRAANLVRNAHELYPAPGLRYGLTYPLAPNAEGLAPLFHTYAVGMARHAEWIGWLTWFRAFGVDAVVAYGDPGLADVRLLGTAVHGGAVARLYAVDGSAPTAWWPRRVVTAESPRRSFDMVTRLADPVATVVSAVPVNHDPAGSVRLVGEGPDRLELEVAAGEGGLAVVRRAYSPIYEARTADGTRLQTTPANLALLGIEVPPGEHRVVLEVSEVPETAAGVVSLLALLAIAVMTWLGGRRRGSKAEAGAAGDAP